VHDELVDLVRRAGAEILEVYDTEFEVETKADLSPVTQADLRAHMVIVDGLSELSGGLPIISEESDLPDFKTRKTWSRYWLVDPLDGTKEFIKRNGEFTVNIALIEGNSPVLGVVGVPVRDEVFFGDVKSRIAYKETQNGRLPLRTRTVLESSRLTVVASRSHGGHRLQTYLDAVADTLGGVEQKPVGSSLKFCILAEGKADYYPRLGPTSEWDIGAAQALLVAAGGAVWGVDGTPLKYNTKDSLLNPDFIAVGDASFDWKHRLPPLPSA
jgi:3'(2'), 5'-bisphosphate nucleotidase